MSDQENLIEEGDESSQPQIKKGGFLSPFIIRVLYIVASVIGIIIVCVLVFIVMSRCVVPTGASTIPDGDTIVRVNKAHLEYMKIDDPFRQQLLDGRMIQLKVSLGFKSGDKKIQTELTQVIPVIRDVIIKHLSRLKSDYFADENALDRLEEDLLKQINRILNEGKVERVYYLEYTLM